MSAKGKKGKGKGKSKSALVGGTKGALSSLSRISEATMPLFPARTHKILRYHQVVTIASTSGVVTNNVFALNSLFAPWVTTSGHQPMGFDQMMVFYNHYAVDRCVVHVNATNTSSTLFHAGIRLDASATPLTDLDRILEFGGVTYDALESKSTYGSSKTFEIDVDIAKVQGIPKKNITTDPNMRGDAGTSPSELSYVHLFACDPVFAASGTVVFDVVMDMHSWFMEPRDGVLSLIHKPDEVKTVPVAPSGWICVRKDT